MASKCTCGIQSCCWVQNSLAIKVDTAHRQLPTFSPQMFLQCQSSVLQGLQICRHVALETSPALVFSCFVLAVTVCKGLLHDCCNSAVFYQTYMLHTLQDMFHAMLLMKMCFTDYTKCIKCSGITALWQQFTRNVYHQPHKVFKNHSIMTAVYTQSAPPTSVSSKHCF